MKGQIEISGDAGSKLIVSFGVDAGVRLTVKHTKGPRADEEGLGVTVPRHAIPKLIKLLEAAQ